MWELLESDNNQFRKVGVFFYAILHIRLVSIHLSDVIILCMILGGNEFNTNWTIVSTWGMILRSNRSCIYLCIFCKIPAFHSHPTFFLYALHPRDASSMRAIIGSIVVPYIRRLTCCAFFSLAGLYFSASTLNFCSVLVCSSTYVHVVINKFCVLECLE